MYSIIIVALLYGVILIYDVYATVLNMKYCYRWETLQASYWYNIPQSCILIVPYCVMIILRKPVISNSNTGDSTSGKTREENISTKGKVSDFTGNNTSFTRQNPLSTIKGSEALTRKGLEPGTVTRV